MHAENVLDIVWCCRLGGKNEVALDEFYYLCKRQHLNPKFADQNDIKRLPSESQFQSYRKLFHSNVGLLSDKVRVGRKERGDGE